MASAPRPLLIVSLLAISAGALACGPGKDVKCDVPSGVLPEVGSPCSPDGQSCTQSEDPCGFVLDCAEGTWQARQPSDAPECQTTDFPTTFGEGTGSSTTGTATTGAATEATATTGPTDCDPLPEEGSACLHEGEFCSSACDDPCQFCNSLMCQGGAWTRLEAPPAQCLDCDSVCEFVLPAECAGGPPDQATCVAGCMANEAGDCMLEFHQMLGCIGPGPVFSCDIEDRPTVIGCFSQFDALYACTGT